MLNNDILVTLKENPLSSFVIDFVKNHHKGDQLDHVKMLLVNEVLPDVPYVPVSEEELDNIAILVCASGYLKCGYEVTIGGKSYKNNLFASGTIYTHLFDGIRAEVDHIVVLPSAVKYYSELAGPKYIQCTTQKARGIMWYLYNYKESVSTWWQNEIDEEAISKTYILPHDKPVLFHYPLFVRPCPVRPRHGFVDSIVAENADQIKATFKSARYHDTRSELLLMPYLVGEYSTVITPNSFCLGLGSSGATNPQYNTKHLTIPIYGPFPFRSTHLKDAGIDDTPYIETVHDYKMGHEIVQLRNGPAVPNVSSNYIPETTVVKHIINTAHFNSLITYEEAVAKAVPGTVIVSNGGSPVSHYAAHAYAHKIPYITKGVEHVEVGKILEPTTDIDNTEGSYAWAVIKDSLESLMDQSLLDLTSENDHTCDIVALSLAIAHGQLVWDKTDYRLNRLTAFGLFAFISAYLASLLGEVRHLCKSNFSANSTQTISKKGFIIYERGDVYDYVLDKPLRELLESLPGLGVDFSSSSWSPGYGGQHWRNSTHAMEYLVHLMFGFINTPCAENWHLISTAWHTCINEQHNNGYILNKFVSGVDYITAQIQPLRILIRNNNPLTISNLLKEGIL